MAGSYCKFCDTRCFVYREVHVNGALLWAGHMATCAQGKAHDRAKLGHDASTAFNPAARKQEAEAMIMLFRIDTRDHTFYVTATSEDEAREKAAELWDLTAAEFDRVGVTPMCPAPWVSAHPN